jgi:dihydrolipoamide dehydrogenase
VAHICARNLERKGVTVHQRAKLLSMQVVDDHVEYEIEQAGGGIERIRVEAALISIGRVANTHSLGLSEIGVTTKPSGSIVNDDSQTSLPHIYAVGDVTDDIALVNVGEIEGRHAAERIAGVARERLSYENLSTIMFLDPEVAAIGINELTAQERRVPYRVAVYGYGLVNRAIAMRSTDGFVKLLVSDDEEHKILGMRALGPHASTMIESVSLLLRKGRSIRELAELLHPHPAITEGLQDCVRMLLGTSIYKPEVFPTELRLARIGYTTGAPKAEPGL